ncbi:MAG: DMT family transporter, partial [Anaerolineales bacterium]
RNWIGLLVSLAGLFLLIGASSSGLAAGSQTLMGDLLILAATVLWSIHTVLLKRLTEKHSALKISAWLMLTGTPLLVIVGLPDVLAQDWQGISRQSWLGLAYSAVLAIAIGYVIWNVGVQRIGGARTSVYSYLNPLISVVVSWAFLGESMQPLQTVGAAAILLGVVLGRSRPKRRASE